MKKWVTYFNGDKVIWSVVLLLSVLSLLTVYSSTVTLAYKFQQGNVYYYMIKHSIILLLGWGLMFFASKLKYTYYSRIFQVMLFIAIPLLLLTLIMGENINQATRVLRIPFIGLTFQTSDLAKVTLIVYLARQLSILQDELYNLKKIFWLLMAPVVAAVLLIMPANFSTAAIVLTISLVLMFVGRVRLTHLALFIGTGILLIAMAIGFLAMMPEGSQWRLPTWKKRVETFFSDEKSEIPYQVEQAKIAIASGGILWGKGPGNSTQRHFLPHPYSDFIYAIIIEEYGLLTGALVVLLYLILFFRAIRIALKSPTMFGAFMVIGMAFSLVFQAMINMGVAVGLLPVTGQPLPLVSMGGTSLWFSSLAIGIILSVSRETVVKDTVELTVDSEENI